MHGAHVNAASVTVPLAKQNPTTALFSAVATFQSCLTGRGVTFVGAPNPKDPATNNPTYLKNLVACAAQSHILQALKTEQSAQDNLTAGAGEDREQGLPQVAHVHDRARVGDPDADPELEGTALLLRGHRWRLVRADDAAAGTEPHLES